MTDALDRLEAVLLEAERRHQKRVWAYERLREQERQLLDRIEAIRNEIERTTKEKALITKASEWAREQAKSRVDHLTTNALQHILEEDISCEAVIEEKRGRPHVDFIIHSTSTHDHLPVQGLPEDSSGGGVADVLGIVLQVILDQRGPFIIDEKTKQLSRDRIIRLSSFLREICEQMQVQMIMLSHETELIESSHRTFRAVSPGEFEVVDHV